MGTDTSLITHKSHPGFENSVIALPQRNISVSDSVLTLKCKIDELRRKVDGESPLELLLSCIRELNPSKVVIDADGTPELDPNVIVVEVGKLISHPEIEKRHPKITGVSEEFQKCCSKFNLSRFVELVTAPPISESPPPTIARRTQPLAIKTDGGKTVFPDGIEILPKEDSLVIIVSKQNCSPADLRGCMLSMSNPNYSRIEINFTDECNTINREAALHLISLRNKSAGRISISAQHGSDLEQSLNEADRILTLRPHTPQPNT